jgi:hypothetical protein
VEVTSELGSDRTTDWAVALVLTLAFLAFSAYAYFNWGAFSDDDLSHYMLARYSWVHPRLFVNMWGRPAYTFLASPFAQFGFQTVRLFNILISVLSCYLAYQIARTLGISRPWLAAAFTAVQPLFLLLSGGALTEPLFSALLAASVLFYLRDEFFKSALCMSVLPLARLEGVLFLAIWPFLLFARGQWKPAASLLVIPLLVNGAGFLVTGEPLYLWRYFPYGTGGGLSLRAQPWAYAAAWPTVTGPALLPLITAGVLGGLGPRKRLVTGLAFVLVLFYNAMYATSRVGGLSNSALFILRFLVGCAPLLGVLAALGVHCLFRRRPVLFGAVIVQALLISWWYSTPASSVGRLDVLAAWMVALAAGNAMRGRGETRLPLQRAFVALALLISIGSIVRWWKPSSTVEPAELIWSDIGSSFRAGQWNGRNIVAANASFWIASGKDPYAMPGEGGFQGMSGNKLPELILSSPPGTIVVWDSHYMARIPRELFNPLQFRIIRTLATSDDPHDRLFRGDTHKFGVIVLEKIG